MNTSILPPELLQAIGSEPQDFAIKAGRAEPLKNALSMLFFGGIWTAFSYSAGLAFLGDLFQGKEVHFKANGVPTVASLDNLGPIIAPGLIVLLFLFIGFAMLGYGVYLLFKRGGYFVGTPTRLIRFQGGSIRSIDWEQFNGDIDVRGGTQSGTITLQLRTGQMVSQKNGPSRYVPETIYISGVPNAFQIEQICRKRIKENDPTPSLNRA